MTVGNRLDPKCVRQHPAVNRLARDVPALAPYDFAIVEGAVAGRLPPSLMISLSKIDDALSAAHHALARRPAARLRLILMIDSRCRGFGSVISEKVSAMI
jgi:hypothetical protein